MSPLSIAVGRPTLADHLFRRRLLTDLVLLAAGAALVALCAQLAIPLWPVPITAQTLAVLLVGASLGAVRGALSLTVYVGLGTLGLPIFSGGSSGLDVLTGGTGGFLIGFILAAGLAGWLAQRRWDRRFLTGVASLAAASAVTFAIGLPWLGVWLGQNGFHNDLPAVLAAGLYPFVFGELVKVLLAALILRLIWRGVARTEAQHPEDPE